MYFTYFGGKLLEPTDRLGSMRFQSGPYLTSTPAVYFPWGQEQTSTQDGTFKFAGYWRDATGGSQDYADQRYYNANYGRFWTPDPGGLTTVHMKNPGSWNRYAYVNGDPVNFTDRHGLYQNAADVGDDADDDADDDTDYDVCMLAPTYSGCGAKSGISATQMIDLASQVMQANKLNQIQRAQAVNAINNIGPGCESAFEKKGFTATNLSVVAAGITFYSTYFEGGLTVNSITGNGDNETLSAYLGDARATTIGNDVILGPEYFTQIGYGATLAASQNITLIHEALHVGTGLNDGQIFTTFNLSSWQAQWAANNNGQILSASQTISYWLSTDCSH
jgi:RHS repeat-associated protein